MNFIRKIVDYVENKLKCNTRKFQFSMTTNALLLDKHIEYFVEHDFHILISLDGNKENTAYRVDKKGKPVFGINGVSHNSFRNRLTPLFSYFFLLDTKIIKH